MRDLISRINYTVFMKKIHDDYLNILLGDKSECIFLN